jgi:hypothetical protein
MTDFPSPCAAHCLRAGATGIIYGRVGSSHLLQLLIGLSSRLLKPRSKLISFLHRIPFCKTDTSRQDSGDKIRHSYQDFVKLSRYCHAGDKREWNYRAYLFLTSALDGVCGQSHAPAALYQEGKTPLYPLVRRMGEPQIWSGHRG